ncbi:hypothetical protein CROQUDRAFT_485503 [Cronartium quercuum f. sp. fusiforme G11]|uniref:Uncharacterized protein n=1 Tax=Cronartium quercuum f. sp. fusiforme G11 TaxID=708437 RepID=A0A9P6NHP4_9BASI|nr:hypothetical protein CROQUDRAFT_485503 [Cronartium quercuum f. sp. fusiforme G11]
MEQYSTIGGGSPPPSNFSNPSDDGVNGDNQSSPSSVQSKSIENPKNTSKDPHGKHDGEKSGKPDDDQDKKESAYSFDEPEGAKTDNAPGGKKKDNHPSSNKMKGHKGDKSGKPSNSDASKVDQDKKESASSFDEPEGAKTEKKDSHPSSDGHPHSKLSSESFDKPEGDAPDDGSDDNKTGDPSNNGDGSPNGSDHHCRENEKYSSTVEACVDTSFFSKPNDDNTCKKGEYDSGIHLCLNASLLGGSQVSPPADDSQDDSSPGPLNAAEAPGDDGTGTDDNQGDDNQDDQPGSNDQSCPKHQRYTSLLSACVDMKLFTKPMSGDRCGSGLHLDLISGLCLDVSASVNVPGLIKANAHGHVET